jgi:hypothetical protein
MKLNDQEKMFRLREVLGFTSAQSPYKAFVRRITDCVLHGTAAYKFDITMLKRQRAAIRRVS